MTRKQAEELITWLLEQAAKVEYGSITISVIRHDGQTRYIEKTIQEKEQVREGGAHG